MVRKGQVIGPATDGQAGGGRRRGGMLPPSGGAPIEVTPEFLAGEAARNGHAGPELGAAGQQGPPALSGQSAMVPVVPTQTPAATEATAATPTFAVTSDLPDPATDPADQLAVCERAIHQAKARFTAKVGKATDEFVDEAGPFLCWVHEHKLYKLMLASNGKPYRSFGKYLKEQHDLPLRTGYRITQTLPLLKILAEGGYSLPDLSARQVAALHPVRTQHGVAAVLRVWLTASETKKGPVPTPEELEKAKQLLGLSTKPEVGDEEDPPALSAADPGAAVERAAKLLVPETVREAVKQDPDRVRLLHRVLSAALSEAGVPVD